MPRSIIFEEEHVLIQMDITQSESEVVKNIVTRKLRY